MVVCRVGTGVILILDSRNLAKTIVTMIDYVRVFYF